MLNLSMTEKNDNAKMYVLWPVMCRSARIHTITFIFLFFEKNRWAETNQRQKNIAEVRKPEYFLVGTEKYFV